MLIRSVWTVSPVVTTSLPRSYNLELVKELHRRMGLTVGEEAVASVSYSGILGAATYSSDIITFHPDTVYRLSLCGLQPSTAKAIASLDLGNHLQFLGADFQISDRVDETSSYETLYNTLVASEPEPQRQFNLQFLSPTAFAQDRIYLPLPVPTLMFRSWLERWNAFAPVYLGGDELMGYLGSTIGLNRHRLQSVPFRIHKGQVTGFQGTVSLRVLNHIDPLLANVANLLIHYADFAGTGIKTRLGMGQTLLIKQHSDCDSLVP